LLRALELALSTRDRVGEVMIKLKMMTSAEVEKWVKVQVSEIVYSIFNWSRGQYAFEDKPAPAESLTLGTPGKESSFWGAAGHLLGAGLRGGRGLNTEYRATKDMSAITAGLPLVPAERDLLKQCDAAAMNPRRAVRKLVAGGLRSLQVGLGAPGRRRLDEVLNFDPAAPSMTLLRHP